MELMDAISHRRSVRKYLATPVDDAVINSLIAAAAEAPSAMNSQPWAFGVITGVERLREYSARAKAYLLARLDEYPMLERYRATLSNPASNLFYDAPALVLIYARPAGPQPSMDCCLAAQTLMLAAYGQGLGSCWIGLSTMLFSSPEVLAELGVPADYTLVAPIVIGYPDGAMPAPAKNPPEIAFWK